MRRIAVLGFLGGMGMMALASDASALEQSTPAIAGRPWIFGEASCFSSPAHSSRITNTGGTGCPNPTGGKSWFVPIHAIQPAVPQTVTHFVRASAGGSGTAPSCKFVRRSATDSSGQLGAPTDVTGALISLGSVQVTPSAGDTLHVDCILFANGKGLTSVKWLAQ